MIHLGLVDLEVLCELDKACFEKSWTREALLEELGHPDALNLGILPKAAILTRQIAGERWIFRIMTHPDFRRQGFAEQLLAALPKEPLWLEVSVLNTGAISFYEREGFKIVGRRPNYYPEEALVMCRY
ncbi:MAG: GNAT family N-acetyltransferase [Myxococcaceae bacterium]